MALRPIGKRLCRILGLNPKMEHVPRPIVLYSACCGIFNANHAKFKLTFTDEEGQNMIFENVIRNMNLVNTLSCVEFSIDLYSCPREDDPDWVCVALKDIDQALEEDMPFGIQELLPEDLALIISMCGGLFKFKEALNIITLCRRVELEERRINGDFDDLESYIGECDSFPQDFKVFLRHVVDPGDQYLSDPATFGPWPKNGAILLTASIPSSNRSLLGKSNYHTVTLMFSEENIGEQRLGLRGPLSFLFGWLCVGNYEDNCNRSLFR